MASTLSDQCQRRHQALYNSMPRKTDTIFSAFTQLPAEIRCAIWEQSLSHERLLHVKLYRNFSFLGSHAVPEGSSEYTLVLSGRCPISKLFRINRESRHIAHLFYRVQLPCVYRWERMEANGTFYFNPDLDILKLDSSWDCWDLMRGLRASSRGFAELAHCIWLNDRRRVGLINLALGYVRLKADQCFEKRFASESTISLLQEALQRLRRVHFICCAPTSRSWCTQVSMHAALQRTYPRVHPVMIHASVFERIRHDPRCIDLKTVYMGIFDPRKQVEAWYRMISRLQVTTKIDYRCMVARHADLPFGAVHDAIHDVDTALDWAENNDRSWEEPSSKLWIPAGGEQQESQTAFGFWLFPIECLEQRQRYRGPYHPERYAEISRFTDLSNFKPELCLFRL